MLLWQYMDVFTPIDVASRAALSPTPGDKVRVTQQVREGDRRRLQVFEGFVIACRHGRESGASFTVRRVSGGIGVEKIFPLYSPNIEDIAIVRRAKVRRAKLYFLREKTDRIIREKLRRTLPMPDPPSRVHPPETVKEKPDEQNTTVRTAESVGEAMEKMSNDIPRNTEEEENVKAEPISDTDVAISIQSTETKETKEVVKEKKTDDT